ncbi:MAG: ATP phosphoribosyltransferase regulatory subunit [Phenylobacterium sp.]|uniref:ATP phosphoribosyltransferase regulatory subunit n=1 Tax=Phenylobacterium sp. TaxID=1871053 RepID=UPI0025D58CD6|nr:ATP phosphoribosyltransferase regulatory subunit [Phenylobacterium sp.]MCG9916438.1 ATP phosphoribosyltransferase regulatory subunit [Phenylobacterium sp.]
MRVEPTLPPAVLAAIRAPFEAVGATLADVPLVQPLNLILDLAGEGLRARLFVVQAEGGAEACLRPDFTAPVARSHLESGAVEGRYIYQGKAFRAAPEHSERSEEFLQLGLERFDPPATDPVSADVEVTALAWRAASAGGRDDLTLWLGDAALFSAFVETLDLAPILAARLVRIAKRPRLLQAELARAGQGIAEAPGGGELADLLADLPGEGAANLLREVWSLAGVSPVGGRGPAEIAERLVAKAHARRTPALTEAQAAAIVGFRAVQGPPDIALQEIRALAGSAGPALEEAVSAWGARLSQLKALGVPEAAFRFAPGVGQAFDYYDGLTFEVRSQTLGADRPVAAGGRYDGLLARLGGALDARAVGCMVRPWRAFAQGEA